MPRKRKCRDKYLTQYAAKNGKVHVVEGMPGVEAVSGHGFARLRNRDASAPAMLRRGQQEDLKRVAQHGRRHHSPAAVNLQSPALLQRHLQLCCAGLQRTQAFTPQQAVFKSMHASTDELWHQAQLQSLPVSC